MKIAVVTPEYPPDTIGGGGVAVQALVREYIREHVVEVFSAADSTRSWVRNRHRDTAEANFVVNRYPLIPMGKQHPYLRSVVPPNLPAWLALRNDLAEWKPDVAHLHGYGYALTDLAAFLLAARHVPYIFTVHGLPATPARRNPAIRAAYRTYQRFGVGKVIRGAQAVTAVSTPVAEAMVGSAMVRVIPNGTSPLPESDAKRAGQLKAKLALANETPIIAAAGRLSTTKGFDVLIEALDHVQVPKVVCVIAGSDGGVADSLAQLAAKVREGVSVKLPGLLNRQELADLFAIANVVVVPSREEPFGLVALEALASRKRLVASNIGGLGEFLNPRVSKLVPPGDVQALGAAITLSLTRGPLLQNEVEEIEDLLARYSWTSIAQEYLRLMADIREI